MGYDMYFLIVTEFVQALHHHLFAGQWHAYPSMFRLYTDVFLVVFLYTDFNLLSKRCLAASCSSIVNIYYVDFP